jgi:mRNA interferase RelE/StbE
MDPSARDAILVALKKLRDDPRPDGIRPLKGRRDYLRLRVGDYRVIYSVDDRASVVLVAVAGHRREVYRR